MQAHFEPSEEQSVLKVFTINLNQKAREGKLDPVIGRDSEIRRLMQILARRTKNNPVLLGDPGVGKTAIVEGLAQRMIEGDVPETLKRKEVLILDLASLLAGSAFRGEFENRIKKLLKEVEEGEGTYILFIDEVHTLVGAGGGEGAVDAANMLKPSLARGAIHMIGATTVDEYRRYIEKDKALERRFQPIFVEEPTVEDTISILRGLKEKYELHHAIRISDDALIAAVTLSKRYIPDRYLPDKAIDLVDEAASSIKIEIESMPTSLDELKRNLTQLEIELAGLRKEKGETGVKRRKDLEEKIENVKQKEEHLKKIWESQKGILSQLNKLRKEYDSLRADLEKAEREILLERAAEIKYGQLPGIEKKLRELEEKWKKIPEGERLLRDEVSSDDIAMVVARWTGIPVTRLLLHESEKLLHLEDELKKRVIGQDEAVEKVAKAIRRNRVGIGEENRPIGVFLFIGPTGVGKTELARALAYSLFNDEKMMIRLDMSEYQEAHTIARLIGAPPGYVGYEEGGQLTEAVRRKPYSVILLDEIEKAHPQIYNIFLQLFDEGRLTDGKGHIVNFTNTVVIMTSNIGADLIIESEKMDVRVKEKIQERIRSQFKPEFINRIDQILLFHNLDEKLLIKITENEFKRVTERLVKQNIHITFTQNLKKYMSKIGFDPQFGARPLKREIQNVILDELAYQLMEKKVKPGDTIIADLEAEKVIFRLPN